MLDLHSDGSLPRRTRSWSPDLSRRYQELLDEDEEESEVLFDACRFPRPTGDLLDCILGEEPWQNAETSDGCKVRIVGDASALKRLFELPLQAAGEALCLHRVGDCLVVLNAPNHPLEEAEDLGPLGQGSPRSPRVSPRVSPPRCSVQVDGDMVRIFPVVETAEPVAEMGEMNLGTAPTASCCEWRVREGLSLMATVPRQMSSGESGLADLSRSSQLRLLDTPSWSNSVNTVLTFDKVGGSLVLPTSMAMSRPSLPEYHRRVTEDKTAVLVVPLNSPLETRTLIDSWLSCCLYGSPSLLCFFVDADGICRGCRFVLAADIPYLEDIAKAYKTGEQRRLTAGSNPAFDPRSLRESTHSLLEMLTSRCDQDGGHFLLVPSPLGPRLVPALHEDDSGDETEVRRAPSLTLPSCAETADQVQTESEQPQSGLGPPRLGAALVTQALLMYNAAVRLAQVHPESRKSTEMKHVPAGARWTAKSCRHPLRVRQMMLRSVRALRSAVQLKDSPARLPRRFQLLLASAYEFLADSFFAEEVHGDAVLDISRHRSAQGHLHKSKKHLAEYANSRPTRACESTFARSVRELEERINAKLVNAHLCLARLYQMEPWKDTAWRNLGLAMKELDAAEDLVAKPNRVTQPSRAAGAYECSLLASISKWKADHLHELAALLLPSVAPGSELAKGLYDYVEAQQKELDETLQVMPTQCERWLQSTVSLCLRALHQLAAVPTEVTAELQVQARFLLARSYSKLGHLYASTGRFTKAMTHAKQGIELFNAIKDKLEAAKLQLWLCRLQLRMALPQAPSSGRSDFGLIKDRDLLSGIPAATAAEDTALRQVVQQLQKSLNALDSEVAEERHVHADGQALLGRVILRQALVKLAKTPAPFNTCGRLCEEELSLLSALELLQAPEASNTSAESSEVTKDAIEKLHQAVSCFRSSQSQSLCALVHVCLAYVYFCSRSDPRIQRLALTHCQHALEQLREPRLAATRVAIRLLEAKVTRRSTQKGQSSQASWTSDAKAASILCEVALRFQPIPAVQSVSRAGDGESELPEPVQSSSDRVRDALLCDDQSGEVAQLMTYLRQELSNTLLRLLKLTDLQDSVLRELKALYCSLLTAWHSENGQVEALTALASQIRKLLEEA